MTGALLSDLSELTQQAFAPTRVEVKPHLAATDFRAYCEYVHEVRLARHHEEWVRILEATDEPRFGIVAPPTSWKSRVLRMWLDYSIGRNPEECWLLLMNTENQAMTQVMSVEDTLVNNPRYHEVFPQIEPNPDKSWSQSRMWVRRKTNSRPDATLYGTGILGPYQGSHVEKVVLDDVTDQEDVFSETKMMLQRLRLRGTLLDRVVKGGRMYALFTRWGQNDLHDDLVRLGFHIVVMPIIGDYPWGALLWPEQFPMEVVEKIRLDKRSEGQGDEMFNLTWLCQADSGQDEVSISGWLYYDPPLRRHGWKVQAWDTAGTTGIASAYSCGLTWLKVGRDYYLLDLLRRKMEYPVLKVEALKWYIQHRPMAMLIENKSTGTSLIQEFRRLRTRKGEPAVHVIGVPIGGKRGLANDKTARAKIASAVPASGRVYLPRNAPWLSAFLAEMASFPRGKYKDQVDAFSLSMGWLERVNPSFDVTVRGEGMSELRNPLRVARQRLHEARLAAM